MYSNISRGINRIFSAFNGIQKLPRAIIKYGTLAFLALFLTGTVLFAVNRNMIDYSLYSEFVATTLIRNSFIVLAEVVVGSLLIDYVSKKN